MKEEFILIIKVDREKSSYQAKGNMTVGMIKLIVGEMELIKYRLLKDLEKTIK